MSKALEENKNTYNELPYISYPFSISRPEKLAANASIFGMTPPKMETARVLELGGASGQNVIRFAADYPKSKVVCVDLSPVQIAEGQKYVDELKLKNIELKAMSITDIDESFGEFDYIICHGVFSWVPDFVREKILEISSKNLSKNGIAYVSYNTFPGWNMVNTVRDMMMFHSEMFGDVADRVNQAKLFVNFVSDSLKDSEAPYAKFLQTEAANLQDKNASYLRHEHLSEENTQFYFHEFAANASKHGLSYLGDTHLHSMYLGNMPEKAKKELSTVGDIVRTEQYMDFITNRRFRCSLLCHKSNKLNRNINFENLQDCFYKIAASYEGDIKEVEVKDGITVNFVTSNGVKMGCSSAVNIAMMLTAIENPGQYFSISEFAEDALAKGAKCTKEAAEKQIYNTMMTLLFAAHAEASYVKPVAVYKISDKPMASKIARAQIKVNPGTEWVSSQTHMPAPIDVISKALIPLLDGKRNHAQLVDELVKLVENKTFVVNANDKPLTDKKQIHAVMESNLTQLLERLAQTNLLVK